jgi:hypothetical protein
MAGGVSMYTPVANVEQIVRQATFLTIFSDQNRGLQTQNAVRAVTATVRGPAHLLLVSAGSASTHAAHRQGASQIKPRQHAAVF